MALLRFSNGIVSKRTIGNSLYLISCFGNLVRAILCGNSIFIRQYRIFIRVGNILVGYHLPSIYAILVTRPSPCQSGIWSSFLILKLLCVDKHVIDMLFLFLLGRPFNRWIVVIGRSITSIVSFNQTVHVVLHRGQIVLNVIATFGY